jgi:hypothetical protein
MYIQIHHSNLPQKMKNKGLAVLENGTGKEEDVGPCV